VGDTQFVTCAFEGAVSGSRFKSAQCVAYASPLLLEKFKQLQVSASIGSCNIGHVENLPEGSQKFTSIVLTKNIIIG
jgi:hypothetical protein